ncbi:MAG: hypothetical protein IAE91_02745 [Ignavibacteriaceae bacterium]|nr:hypothetical protein [Ignavibacteriaceae bacterium]
MKIIVSLLILITVIIFNYGCTKNTDPQIRIQNKNSVPVEVKITLLEERNDSLHTVDVGATTDYKKINAGEVTVFLKVRNQSISFLATKSNSYTIVIPVDEPPAVIVDL